MRRAEEQKERLEARFRGHFGNRRLWRFCDSEGGVRWTRCLGRGATEPEPEQERETSGSRDGDNGEDRGTAARRSRLMLAE